MKKLLFLLLIAPVLGFGQLKNLTFDLLYNYELTRVYYEDLRDDFIYEITVQDGEIILLADGNKQHFFQISINNSKYFIYDEPLVFLPGTLVKFKSNSNDWVSFLKYKSKYSEMDYRENTPIRDFVVLNEDNPSYTIPAGHYLEVLSANLHCEINGIDDYLAGNIVIPSGNTLSFNGFSNGALIGLLIELTNQNLAYNVPQQSTPTLYPNPTSSLLALNSDKDYDIEVYDMLGNKIKALTGNSINMEHLSTATYIVKATDKSNNEELTYKVVKN